MSEEEKTINVIVKNEKGKDKDPKGETPEEKIKRLEEELEDRDEKLGILSDEKKLLLEKEFERKKAKLGCKDSSITTVEQLMAWASGAGKKSEAERDVDPITKPSSGTLTLQGQNAGVGFLQKKYEGDSEGFRNMIDDLHEKAHSEDPEKAAGAQAILDELLRKSVKDTKEGKKTAGDVIMKLDMKKHNKRKAEKQND